MQNRRGGHRRWALRAARGARARGARRARGGPTGDSSLLHFACSASPFTKKHERMGVGQKKEHEMQ